MLQELLKGEPKALTNWLIAPSLKRILVCIITIIVGCGLYGLTLGIWRSPMMGLYVGVKFPLLIFLTLGCNGFLNGVVGMLLGSGLGFRQSILALLMSYSIFALILGSLSFVTLFFAINAPSPDSENAKVAHSCIMLLHVLLIAYAGVASNHHLLRCLKSYCPSVRAASLTLFSWLAGNAFMGAQFSWILRPFFGSPGLDVSFLREDPMNGTFYGAVYKTLQTLLNEAGISLAQIFIIFVIISIMTITLSLINKLKQNEPR